VLVGGKRWSQSKFAARYTWRTNGVSGCKMNVRSAWIPTWHQMDHVFVVTWTMFKTASWREASHNTRRPWHSPKPHNCCFITFYHVLRTLVNKKIIERAFGWEPGHIRLHTTLEGPGPHYMMLEVKWDGLWTPSFGLSQFHGHGSWLVCEVALGCDEYIFMISLNWRSSIQYTVTIMKD
jgi:hypothetical protein